MKYATKKILRDYTATVLIAVGLAMLIRTYVVEAYRIPNQSMKPALLAGDTIFVAKWPQKLNGVVLPGRGDLVVFKTPGKGPDAIRRVVGLPGDSVELRRGRLFLNGVSLVVSGLVPGPPPGFVTQRVTQEKTAPLPCFREAIAQNVEYQICEDSPLLPDFGPERVPNNSVFVLEDSRTITQQKPVRGIIPVAAIQGRALWIWLSIEDTAPFSWLPRFRMDRMFRHI